MYSKVYIPAIFSYVSLSLLSSSIGTVSFQFLPVHPAPSIRSYIKPGFQSHQSFFNLHSHPHKSALNESKELSNPEISRYSRHLVLSDVGMKGQKDLKNASVLVIGAGGLGSPCLMYLAAAGVGNIGIVVSDNYHEKID